MGLQYRVALEGQQVPQMQITGVGPCVLGDTTEGLSEHPGCGGVHHGTGQYKQCALRIKRRMEGETHLTELNCVLPVVYESTDAPVTGTWLFTTFAYGKSGKYEHIC